MASQFGLREPLPEPAPPPFGPHCFGELFDEGLRCHPDRLALIDGDRTWTWEQLQSAVIAAAEPIRVDQPMSSLRENSAEMIIGVLAILHAGGIWAGNPPDSWQVGPDSYWRDLANDDQQGAPHAPASISFTSGTTGSPKAVVHSQHGLLLPGIVSVEVEPPVVGERLGTPLDLNIANVFVLGPLSALLRGSTFVVMRRRYAAGLADDVAAHSVTRLLAVPTLAYDLAHNSAIEPELLGSLDRVILGGSGSDPDVLEQFRQRFGVRPTLSYGLSEAPTGVVRESLDDPIGSGRGFPLPHVEVSIAAGEICIQPASTGPWSNCWTGALGYLNDPERTDAVFRNGGLLHTGDRGHLDADGALSVTGRLSNLIIRGAKNIDPVMVENAARSLDVVTDASAIGLPDERLGQVVGLALVLDPSRPGLTDLDTAEMAQGLEAEAGTPIDEICVVDHLPRNAMGKVDSDALARLF